MLLGNAAGHTASALSLGSDPRKWPRDVEGPMEVGGSGLLCPNLDRAGLDRRKATKPTGDEQCLTIQFP